MTLKASDDWENLVEKSANDVTKDNVVDVKQVMTVPANGGAALSFPIVPSKLGNIPIEVLAQTTTAADSVRRMLLVEVGFEGISLVKRECEIVRSCMRVVEREFV